MMSIAGINTLRLLLRAHVRNVRAQLCTANRARDVRLSARGLLPTSKRTRASSEFHRRARRNFARGGLLGGAARALRLRLLFLLSGRKGLISVVASSSRRSEGRSHGWRYLVAAGGLGAAFPERTVLGARFSGPNTAAPLARPRTRLRFATSPMTCIRGETRWRRARSWGDRPSARVPRRGFQLPAPSFHRRRLRRALAACREGFLTHAPPPSGPSEVVHRDTRASGASGHRAKPSLPDRACVRASVASSVPCVLTRPVPRARECVPALPRAHAPSRAGPVPRAFCAR